MLLVKVIKKYVWFLQSCNKICSSDRLPKNAIPFYFVQVSYSLSFAKITILNSQMMWACNLWFKHHKTNLISSLLSEAKIFNRSIKCQSIWRSVWSALYNVTALLGNLLSGKAHCLRLPSFIGTSYWHCHFPTIQGKWALLIDFMIALAKRHLM